VLRLGVIMIPSSSISHLMLKYVTSSLS